MCKRTVILWSSEKVETSLCKKKYDKLTTDCYPQEVECTHSFNDCFKLMTKVSLWLWKWEFQIPNDFHLVSEQNFCMLIGRFSYSQVQTETLAPLNLELWLETIYLLDPSLNISQLNWVCFLTSTAKLETKWINLA